MRYNAAIDSLRAISIILVLFFHACPALVPSGYIGVDIFFVISGYLITKTITTEISLSRFSYLGFYRRRIVRLFPALLIMLTLASVVGWCFLSDTEFIQLARHTLSSMGFFQNINLLNEVGYFDAAADTKPLLHLWSLSVEEQFYLVWPFLILYFSKEKSPAKLILQVSLASYFLNLLYFNDYDFIFYAPFTRLWELSLGGLIVFLQRDYPWLTSGLNNLINKSSKIKKLFPTLTFLIFILFSIFNTEKIISPFMLLIILAWAFVFIVYATDANNVNIKVFKSLSYLGLISYPLYLYHWPIIVFFKTLVPDFEYNQMFYTAIAIGVSIAMSVLTYEFIEKPFKNKILKNPSSYYFKALIVFFVALGGFNIAVYLFKGFPQRYLKNSDIQPAAPAITCAERMSQICELSGQDIFLNKNFCEKNRASHDTACELANFWTPAAVIVGDSHVRNYFAGLKKHYTSANEGLLLLSQFGTLPFSNTITLADQPRDMNGLLNYIIQNQEIKTVYLAGYWLKYYYDAEKNSGLKKLIEHADTSAQYKKLIQGRDQSGKTQKESFKTGLLQTLNLFKKSGKKVFVLLDPPTFFNWQKCVRRPFHDLDEKNCSIPAEDFHLSSDEVNNVIKDIAQNFSNTRVIDPTELFCDDKFCYAAKNKTFFYHDANHLSDEGSNYMVKPFLDELMDN